MSPTVTSTYQRTGRERKIQPHISLQGTLTGGPGDWVKVMSIKGKQPFPQRQCPGRELFTQFSANWVARFCKLSGVAYKCAGEHLHMKEQHA